MDREGVREVFLAEAGDQSHCGVREALRALPFLTRATHSYFHGVHLPLTYRLPKRLDRTLQQFTGMCSFDAIVLAGIDPVILDADDLLNLCAYVERGGGLMLIGGSHAFDNAQRGFGPLETALPARPLLKPESARPDPWDWGGEVEAPIGADVRLAGAHPITRGLSGEPGRVSVIQPLELRQGAEVLAEAGGQPVVVCGTHGAGRVVIIATYPDGAEQSGAFFTPGWSELTRQALSWLMRRDGDLVIERTEMNRTPLGVGGSRTFSLELASQAGTDAAASATVASADEGWLATGREPVWGEPQEIPVRVEGGRVECEFCGRDRGLHQVRIEVSGPDWANVREALVEVRAPDALRLSTRRGLYVTAPGKRLTFEIACDAERAPCALRVLDFDGHEVFSAQAEAPGTVEFEVPHLELGHYEAIAERDGEEARMRFLVTEPLRDLHFTVVAMTNVGEGTEERIGEVYEYHRSRGFNGYATALQLDETDSPRARGSRYVQYLAQRDGFVLWGEYVGATLLKTHGLYCEEGEDATRPCVLSPEFTEATREFLEAKYQAASDIPRMTSLEIIDEPHFYRGNVCRCEDCLNRFEHKYGHPMPTWDEAIEARDQRTRNYFDWVIAYGTEAFRKGIEIWHSFPQGPKLHHVFCGIGSGQCSARACVASDLEWSPHADFCEFDCYNYMYAHWRCSEVLKFNEFHYRWGVWRALGLRNNQRVGFFIQVTDRDVPVAPYDPLRSSSEVLYTAIGGGAKYLHLMAKTPFTDVQNCREEKFDIFAEDVRRVQRAAPLLYRAESPRSHIAMMYPHYDRIYRPPVRRLPEGYVGLGYYSRDARPYDTIPPVWPYHAAQFNAYELLFRCFGEADVLFDQALAEGALDDYEGFVLPDTDYIPPDAAAAIVRFVERGGALVCDRVPGHSTTGGELTLLDQLFTGQEETLWGDLTLRCSTFGEGKTLLFSQQLQDLYSSSIEQNQPALRYLLKDTVREFLFGCGIRPHALSSNYEIEADVLLTEDTIVLVAVSHAEDRQQSRITLYRPLVPVRCAFDLVTMQEHEVRSTDEGVEVDVDLGEREGLLLGLYAERPVESRLEANGAESGRLAFTVTLLNAEGKPARGDHIVEVEVTDPAGERRLNYSGLRCTRNGVLSFDEPLALNARRGTWTATVFDRFTRARHSVSIESCPGKGTQIA